MAPGGEAYHIDWIFSNTSNVHAANNKDWFINFVEFKSKTNDGQEVLGIGDVELDVKTSATRKGSSSHRKMVLQDVLYVPSMICNILGGPILDKYSETIGAGGSFLKNKETGACAGILERVVLYKLWLVGQQRGKSSLDKNGLYYINVGWSDDE